MDYQDAYEQVQIIVRWMQIRETNGHPPIETPHDFDRHAEHSLRGGLLGRMLISKKEPLAHPPPLAFSRPWYSLIENGSAILDGDFVYPGIEKSKLAICQHQWDIVDQNEDRYILAWKPDENGDAPWGHWSCDRVPEGWKLSRLDVE